MTNKGRRLALKMIAVQSLICLVLVVFFYLYGGGQAGFSALLGAVVCILPNIYFSTKVFANSGAQRAHQLVRSFYVGETIKTLLTIGLFVVCYLFFDVVPAPMLVVFIVGLLTHRLAPLIITSVRH